MATFPAWIDELGRQLGALAEAFWLDVRERGVAVYVQPVGPYGRSLVAPLVTAAGILGIIVLAGVAVTAMGTAVLALVALWLLLSQVFGFSLEFAPVFGGRS